MSYVPAPLKPGVVKDDEILSTRGWANDSDWVRFVGGFAQAQGGYQKKLDYQMHGICRGMFEWSRNDGGSFVAIGTHCKLYIHSAGYIINVTPERTNGTYALNPFATTNGSAVVQVTHTAHGCGNGDTVYISGSAAVGGITPGGPSGAYAASPFETFIDSNVVLVTHVSHGMATSDEVTVSGGAAVGGITISGTYIIRVINASQYQIYHGSAATSSAVGGGTPNYAYGRAYEITYVSANVYNITHIAAATSTATGGGAGALYRYEITCGLEDGISNTGYSTGPYSAGPYSVSFGSGTATQEPRTWSFAQAGEILIGCPSGGYIYQWDGNWSVRATRVTNSPAENLYIVVTAQRQIMSMGCTNLSSVFDPTLLRWCDVQNITTWTPAATNNAGTYKLGVGSRIVGGLAGDNGTFCWTDEGLYFIVFVGTPEQTYRADLIGPNFGLAGPNAFIDNGEELMWITPRGSFARYNGGRPRELICKSKQWMIGLTSQGQLYKIYGFYDQRFPAATWIFPTGNGLECNTYIRLDFAEESKGDEGAAGWSVGTIDRTAWLDSQRFQVPLAVSSDGYLYEHEIGNSADGGALNRYIEYQNVWEHAAQGGVIGDRVLNLNRFILGATVSAGNLTVTYQFRRDPMDTAITVGPNTWGTTTDKRANPDPRGQGKIIGLLFESTGTNDNWRLGESRGDITGGAFR